jgi:thiamine biosynthesis lipoprotein
VTTTWSAHWAALGTGVDVFVDRPESLETARQLVAVELDGIDRACSRFRDDSELSQVSRRAGRWVDVSPLCLEAIEAGLRAARLTGGAVDPTVGRSLRLLGYDRDFDELEGPAPHLRLVSAPGWSTVEVDRRRGSVRVPRGVELDLGATAKALAADRCAAVVNERLGCSTLVSLGGDLALGGPAPAGGWPVRVTEDHAAGFDAPGQTISLSTGALATSSTATRRWTAPEGDRHHIVDPATGRPAAEVWRAVSVAAASCVDANTASTAAIVLGPAAPAWLAKRRLPSRLLARDGRVTRVGGWPAVAA